MKKFVECKTRALAKKACPWAVKIAKVEDGYMCFETTIGYDIWKIGSRLNRYKTK